ncbi:MAG TPA: response regulator transcription factor [Candidatus Sulfotelmatobacter sp.]|nr:response regulator transcription factor [Candidatus Sulfotelmatobacter sp.]
MQYSAAMKLLIVDDHVMVREGLAALLAQVEAGTTVLQASNGDEGLAVATGEAVLDAAFLDLAMPGGGIAAIRAFRERCPRLPIIVLSSSEDPADVRQALAAGALGYLPKSAGTQTMLSALRLVLSGEVYVPSLMLEAGNGNGPRNGGDGESGLTERQIAVLHQLCRGASNKEIARVLDISEKTIKAHITAIFRTLGVVNRLQAAAAARRLGLVQD